MAAASPRSTQLPPGSQMPGGFARGDRDDGGCVAVGVGLAAADPVEPLPVGLGTGATVAGADGVVVGGADGPGGGGVCCGGSGWAGGGVGWLPAGGLASAGRTSTQVGSMWLPPFMRPWWS